MGEMTLTLVIIFCFGNVLISFPHSNIIEIKWKFDDVYSAIMRTPATLVSEFELFGDAGIYRIGLLFGEQSTV